MVRMGSPEKQQDPVETPPADAPGGLIHGHKLTLSGDRHVFVAEVERNGKDWVLVEFRRPITEGEAADSQEGEQNYKTTRLTLSSDAADALAFLLAIRDEHRSEPRLAV
jgi:hypothetical protein